MILTLAFGAFAVVVGMFLLLFLDSCPPALCSVDTGVSAVLITLLIAAAIGLLGFTITIVQLVRRALAWPYAVAMLVLCVTTCVIGVYIYGDAVGAEEGWLFGNY